MKPEFTKGDLLIADFLRRRETAQDKIEQGIFEVVLLFVRHGFTTTSSCAGGEGHGFEFPTVVIKDNGKVTADMIAGVLVGAGHSAFTVQHNQYYQDSPIRWKSGNHNFTVELWSKNGN